LVQLSSRAKVAFAARCVERVRPAIEAQTAIEGQASILDDIVASVTLAREVSLGIPVVERRGRLYSSVADKLRRANGAGGVEMSVGEAVDTAFWAALEADSPFLGHAELTRRVVDCAASAYRAAEAAYAATFHPPTAAPGDLEGAVESALLASEALDLRWLREAVGTGPVAAEFFDRPLWSSPEPACPGGTEMSTVRIASQYVNRMMVYVAGAIDNIFISYHHADEPYKRDLEAILAKLEWSSPVHQSTRAANVSVKAGDIVTTLADRHIMTLIRERHISETTLVIVLVGDETSRRKFVDWEIAAGLEVGSAVLGLLLPTFLRRYGGTEKSRYIPPRLLDNVLSGHAALHTWDLWLSNDWTLIEDPRDDDERSPTHVEYSPIERALNDAVARMRDGRPENGRPLFRGNLPRPRVQQ
jgi:hypothetical protein